MLAHVVHFAHALRAAGIPVNPADLIDLCRCFGHVNIADRRDVHAAARATLVHRYQDLERFDQVFQRFWTAAVERLPAPPSPQDGDGNNGAGERSRHASASDDDSAQHSGTQEAGSDGYSAREILMERDLGAFTEGEIEQARRLLAELVDALASERGRRYAPDSRGTLPDFRRMLRRHALHGPDCVQLLFRRKKVKKPRLMLFCDVSGSMERYSRFLIEFVYALRRVLPDVEVGVFATRMTVITQMLANRRVEQSLAQVAQGVRDWGGGTDIGGCLHELNDRFAHTMLRSKTVVVILSDGWDRGDPCRMRDEIKRLRQRAHRLVWLNPLLGADGYQPLCRGIGTVLPYIDHFLPAHNLASLANVARMLHVASTASW